MQSDVIKRILNGDAVRSVIDEAVLTEKQFNGSGKHINYEDDLVRVYDENGEEIYAGLEDYEEWKDEPWKWNDSIGAYTLTINGKQYIKNCV